MSAGDVTLAFSGCRRATQTESAIEQTEFAENPKRGHDGPPDRTPLPVLRDSHAEDQYTHHEPNAGTDLVYEGIVSEAALHDLSSGER
jgi:hypothetical protein